MPIIGLIRSPDEILTKIRANFEVIDGDSPETFKSVFNRPWELLKVRTNRFEKAKILIKPLIGINTGPLLGHPSKPGKSFSI